MNVLFATTDFVENNGPTTGLPKYLLRTSLKLIEWGHNVTVVTCANRTVQYEFYGINVRRVRGYNIKTFGDLYKDELYMCMRNAKLIHNEIERVIQCSKIDIIQYASISGIAYLHDFNIPSVVRLSSYSKMWPLVGQEMLINARTKMEIEAVKKCNAIISPSILVANEVSKDCGRKVDVIETPFVMENKSENFYLYDKYLKGKQYILFFGTIIEYKGICVIKGVAKRMLETYPNLHLVIIGDGDTCLIDRIVSEIGELKGRFFYHSAVGFDTLCPIIKNSYAVILPSLMENFSNACVEAMALGKVVIGTKGASFEQLIDDGVNGLLCEPGNSDSLLNAIHRLMRLTIVERNEIEKNAVKRTNELTPEKVTMQLLKYYEKIIKQFTQ